MKQFKVFKSDTKATLRAVNVLWIWTFVCLRTIAYADQQRFSALDKLDKAAGVTDLQEAEKELNQTPSNSMGALKTYVADKTKSGQKRFIVFRAMQQNLPTGEKEQRILRAFRESDNLEFKVSCMSEFGHINDLSVGEQLKGIAFDASQNVCIQLAAFSSLARHGQPIGKGRALRAILSGEPCDDIGMEILATLKSTDVIPNLNARIRQTDDGFIKNDCRKAILTIELAAATTNDRKISLLKTALMEPDFFHVRQWAASRLANLGTPTALSALAEVAKNEKAPGKESARNGLLLGVTQKSWSEEDIKRELGK